MSYFLKSKETCAQKENCSKKLYFVRSSRANGVLLLLQYSHLRQDEDVGMVPDPAEVLHVIEEPSLLSTLKLSVSTNLTCFCIVLQIEPAIFGKLGLANGNF